MQDLSWEFDAGAAREGWTPWNHPVSLQVTDGRLITKSTGADPLMASPKIAVAVEEFPNTEIRMMVSAGNTAHLLLTTDSDETYDESNLFHRGSR